MANVRAKFKVSGKTAGDEGGNVNLEAVTDGSEENKKFFRWTPSGRISLGTVNQAAFDAFEDGKEYYVDFSPAVG